MSEQRQPDLIVLVRSKHKRKSNKVELFRGTKWDGPADKYRLRVNGKFFPKSSGQNYKYYSLEEVTDMLHKELKNILA
jgi:hypothetical protein